VDGINCIFDLKCIILLSLTKKLNLPKGATMHRQKKVIITDLKKAIKCNFDLVLSEANESKTKKELLAMEVAILEIAKAVAETKKTIYVDLSKRFGGIGIKKSPLGYESFTQREQNGKDKFFIKGLATVGSMKKWKGKL
jgi:hypothetical protein